jgi:two-component system response regulator NreC
MAVRILIADDHGLVRGGLRAMLEDEPAIEVVAEAGTGEEALRLARELVPDIVLLDIGLPDMDGIETTRWLKKLAPQIKVLILSVYEDESLLREAIKAGAAGYMIKRAAEEDLMAAIQAISRGDMYIHPAITRLLIKDFSQTVEAKKGNPDTLTPRELEVMKYIIRGFTNRQIAETLLISVRTVEGHRASILSKLGLRNRVDLVEYAEKYGLMD